MCMCTHVYLFVLEREMNSSLSVFHIVRLNPTDVYPICNRINSQGYWSVCPRLKNLLHYFKWGFVFVWLIITQQNRISKNMIVLDLTRVFVDDIFFFCDYLRWSIYVQSAICLLGRIMSWTNTRCPGLFPLILLYVDCTEKAVAAKITIHGSASSTYFSCRF